MALRTIAAKRIEEIPREDWESVYPDVLEGYDFFRSLDESNFEQFSFYYIVVYDGAKAVGAAPCFLLKYSLDTSLNGTMRQISNFIKKGIPGFLSVKALACGVPMGKGQMGIAGNNKETLEVIVKKMEEVAGLAKARIIAFKDFPREYEGAFGALAGKGFFKIDSLPYAEMDIKFKNFDEYLNKLSGASRYDLRRKFKKAEGSVRIDMEIIDSPDEDTFTEMYGLYTQILKAHEMSFEVAPKDFFKNMAKNMPAETKFFLWRIEGRLAAFLFALTSGGVFIDYYLGLDYEFAHKYHLFFIKFRDVMKWAIENGIKRYEIGFSGYEPKRRLGFDFTPLNIYVRHRNRIINPLFKMLAHFLKFENFDPDLKMIKNSASR